MEFTVDISDYLFPHFNLFSLFGQTLWKTYDPKKLKN